MCHDYPPENRVAQWESTVAQQRAQNIHIHDDISEDEFVTDMHVMPHLRCQTCYYRQYRAMSERRKCHLKKKMVLPISRYPLSYFDTKVILRPLNARN